MVTGPDAGPDPARTYTWAELLLMWELGRSFERTRLLDLENEAADRAAAYEAKMRAAQAAPRQRRERP